MCFRYSTAAEAGRVNLDKDVKYQDAGVILSFKQSCIFRVKINSDAYIALTSKKNQYDGEMYEIVIGASSNTTSIMRYISTSLSRLESKTIYFVPTGFNLSN